MIDAKRKFKLPKVPDIGKLIEKNVKKGISKVEEIFKSDSPEDQEKEDKIFAYIKALIDDRCVAALTPSSQFIVKRVVRAMDLKHSKVIVEYGAAQGVMTKVILEKMRPDAVLVAIELNDELFRGLRKLSDPRLRLVHGDVRDIVNILKGFGLEKADVIISGIPFAFLTGRGRHELLLNTCELLNPSGRFVAYQVTTHLIPLLKDYFRRVKTEFEIRNLPPHFVFTAFK